MRILANTYSLPSFQITSDWILQKLRTRNCGRMTNQELDRLLAKAAELLANAGSETKRQASPGERGMDFAVDAGRRAIDESGIDRSEIDLLLYTSVGRGWLEPATANVVQQELGLSGATAFDILDGCAGWLRALEVTRAYAANGTYRNCLIVTCECGLAEFGRWDFDSADNIDAYLATYTIGEAATATVVSDDNADDDFYFRFRNFGQYADLCMIPLETAAQFLPSGSNAPIVPMKFYARSGELMSTAIAKIVETYRLDPTLRSQSYDLLVGHAASEKASEAVRRELGLPEEAFFSTHRRYGNTVAASIPLALALAEEQGKLERGNKVLAVSGASGITVGIASFTY